ncbi:Helicase PriA essential for oriC/DnaA-independent DNA replication [Fulvivirga imtechensis AK7]|uniref:Replication restart protein PriA n=1 Tax=Fulvivirga imtechensis AK7 TaxID=1237149 RepID=L8JVS1_9BACT|nr:Helicase PriA essential for oriC/DnaA-independent DNA replication [Fulvivirga imtechensis AK7]
MDVMLPVPIPKMFTYRVPYELNEIVQVGCRVIVQFGSRKILTGVIGRIHEIPPEKYEAKTILELLDEEPVIHKLQITLFQWMADYYMCTLGEVLNIALPSGLKLSSESRIQLHPHFDYYGSSLEFSDKETLLLETLLKNDSLSYSEISKLLHQKTIYTIIKSLVYKEAVIIFEEVKEKYKPKKETRVRIAPHLLIDHQLEALFDLLASKPKQEAILLHYLQHVPVFNQPELNRQGLAKNTFGNGGLSESSLKTLVKNGVFEEFEIIISRFGSYDQQLTDITLTAEQEKAKANILESFKTKDTTLLHGITGSGKTEIYISLIQDALEGGSQVLYLLPEIALTTQIVTRLRKVFGDQMGVYHSRFSDNERVEVWKGVLNGKYQFVVGVRSSIFLPFDNLGLIIVDEEHESSYKQYDPAPRYSARDVAIVIAAHHHAKVLLGSATPSMESQYQARQGKYGLVKLTSRYGMAVLPEFAVADMIRERNKKLSKGEFSSLLIEAINEALDNKEQVIIFQNRRGYSPYITCHECGWIPKCTNCAVSLTYHQYRAELRCHYCGYKEPMPTTCEACGSTHLKTIGFGTEKLEEEIALLFPQAKVQRMDLDTTRRKNSYDTIIKDFEQGHIDILVGTQMVSKGLDFDNVSLVGIFDIDRMLHFPDFRSFERTFQLSTQVSGRAGRRGKKGKVVIQTRNTSQRILHQIISNGYQDFYETEINERKAHLYPPFTRIIGVTIKNKDPKTAKITAMKMGNLVREKIGTNRVLGPEEPIISKIRNEYLMELVVKLERSQINLGKVKSLLYESMLEVLQEKELRSSKIIFDVDPY